MRICIVSHGDEFIKLYRTLKDVYDIRYVLERDCESWGMTEEGIACISFGRAYQLYKSGEIEAFLIPCMRGINIKIGIFDRLTRNGVSADNILYAPLRFFRDKDISEDERKGLICLFKDRSEIDFLAMHIADGCNLGCAYCSVLSGSCGTEEMVPLDDILHSVDLLSGVCDQVTVFRLLGGEPLLNPDWPEICARVKSRFPLADVEIVTNGLLLPSLPDERLRWMSEQGITFDITDYSILGGKIDEIHERLSRLNVRHYITQEVEYFSRLYDFERARDPEENYEVCRMKFMCMNMRGYKLSVCHAAVGLERAAKMFPEISYEDTGAVDLRTEGITFKDIMEKLDRPHDMCKYCNQDLTGWHRVSDRTDIKEWSL